MDSTQARVDTQTTADGARLAAVPSGAKGKNAALDPFAKIAEFKYCAIKVQLEGQAPVLGSHGGGQVLERLNA
jgi:hypothetical protein